jgi:hypothetical protein
MNKVQYLKQRYEALKADRQNWDDHWDDVARFIVPKKDDIYNNRNHGEKKGQALYDTTAAHSNTLLASALHGMLTNPSLLWFGMSASNLELQKNERVRRFFQDCVQIMHNTFNDTNFQTQIHEVYQDLGSFGTAILLMEEDKKSVINFNSIPVFTTYLKENSKGIVDTVYRDFEWDLKQIVQEFGIDSIPKDLARDLKGNTQLENKKYQITHMVEPRLGYLENKGVGNKAPAGMQFASHYMICSLGHLLSEGGYQEFPYAAPRWSKTSYETYGRSPGMESLPDNKMLNEMMKVTIRSAQKTIDPPLNIPDDGAFRPVKMIPGGLNYYRAGTTDRIEPILTNPRIDFGQFMLNDIRGRIRQAYFIEWKVNYVSQIAKAQKASEADNLLRVLQSVMPIVEADPSIMDNIDGDAAFKYSADLFNLPQEIMRTKNDVTKMRQSRAEQQQQAMQQQQQQSDAEVASKMSNMA